MFNAQKQLYLVLAELAGANKQKIVRFVLFFCSFFRFVFFFCFVFGSVLFSVSLFCFYYDYYYFIIIIIPLIALVLSVCVYQDCFVLNELHALAISLHSRVATYKSMNSRQFSFFFLLFFQFVLSFCSGTSHCHWCSSIFSCLSGVDCLVHIKREQYRYFAVCVVKCAKWLCILCIWACL